MLHSQSVSGVAQCCEQGARPLPKALRSAGHASGSAPRVFASGTSTWVRVASPGARALPFYELT